MRTKKIESVDMLYLTTRLYFTHISASGNISAILRKNNLSRRESIMSYSFFSVKYFIPSVSEFYWLGVNICFLNTAIIVLWEILSLTFCIE